MWLVFDQLLTNLIDAACANSNSDWDVSHGTAHSSREIVKTKIKDDNVKAKMQDSNVKAKMQDNKASNAQLVTINKDAYWCIL